MIVGTEGRAAGDLIQQAFDVRVGKRRAFDRFDVRGRFILGEQLHRTDAVAPDGLQQIEASALSVWKR